MKRYIRSGTTVRTYQNKRNANKYLEEHDDGYGHRSLKQYMSWDTEDGPVVNPTGDGNLHRWRKANRDELLEDYNDITYEEPVDEFGNPVEQYPNPEVYGATDPYEGNNYDWMLGLYWDIDGHSLKVTQVDSQLSTAVVTESWISEDTLEDREDSDFYVILKDDGGHIYLQNKAYPDYKLYAQNAFNYSSKVPRDQDELAFLRDDEDDYDEDYQYDEEDDYRSATRGDYSPSSPWNAPGMSVSDFI